jgi:hypothetical protein
MLPSSSHDVTRSSHSSNAIIHANMHVVFVCSCLSLASEGAAVVQATNLQPGCSSTTTAFGMVETLLDGSLSNKQHCLMGRSATSNTG